MEKSDKSIDLSIKLCQAIVKNDITTVIQCLEKEKADPNQNPAQLFQHLSEGQQQTINSMQRQLGEPFDRPILFLPINIAIQNIVAQSSVQKDGYNLRSVVERNTTSIKILYCLVNAPGVNVNLGVVDFVNDEKKLPATTTDFVLYSLAKSEKQEKSTLVRSNLYRAMAMVNKGCSPTPKQAIPKQEVKKEEGNTKEKHSNQSTVSDQSVRAIVKFLQTGEIDFANLEDECNVEESNDPGFVHVKDKDENESNKKASVILSIYFTARRFQVDNLVQVCERELAQILEVSNLRYILETAVAWDSDNLKKVCFAFMKENAAVVVSDHDMNAFAMEHKDLWAEFRAFLSS